MTDRQLLAERNRTKRERISGTRQALGVVFGRHRVTVHAGSRSYGEDTTHWLYIGIYLRKGDRRAHWPHEKCRSEVVRILKRARVHLYETSFAPSSHDPYAISLDMYPHRPKRRG